MCEESQRVLVILIKNKNSKSKSGQSAVQKLIASPVHEMPRLTTFIVIFVHLTLRLAREIRRGNRLRSKIKRALSTNKTKKWVRNNKPTRILVLLMSLTFVALMLDELCFLDTNWSVAMSSACKIGSQNLETSNFRSLKQMQHKTTKFIRVAPCHCCAPKRKRRWPCGCTPSSSSIFQVSEFSHDFFVGSLGFGRILFYFE